MIMIILIEDGATVAKVNHDNVLKSMCITIPEFIDVNWV